MNFVVRILLLQSTVHSNTGGCYTTEHLGRLTPMKQNLWEKKKKKSLFNRTRMMAEQTTGFV